MTVFFRIITLLATFYLPCFAQAQVCQNTIATSASSVFFETSESHTLADKRTNIVWSRCAVGQHWQSGQCAGIPSLLSFSAAKMAVDKSAAAENLRWRMPTMSELSLLVELRCYNPAIDLDLFPNTPSGSFWTRTRFVNKTKHHWQIQFRFGANLAGKDSSEAYLRLVRDRN